MVSANVRVNAELSGQVRKFLIESVAEIAGESPDSLDAATRLSGARSVLDSRDLVELLLATEDYAQSQFGVRFNWTPRGGAGRAVFETIGSLAEHVAGL